MKRLIQHMIYQTLGILLVVLAVAPAMAQKPVQYIPIPQCEVLVLSVVDMPGDEYTWDFYKDSTANFAREDDRIDPVSIFQEGDYRDESTVVVHYLDPGRYFLRVMVWDEVQCTNNLLLFAVNVIENLPTVVLEGDSVCEDEIAQLKVIFTGMAPWEATYTYGDGTVTLNLNGETEDSQIISAPWLPVGTHEFWVMEVTDQCTVNSYPVPNPEKGIIKIFPRPVSTQIYVGDE